MLSLDACQSEKDKAIDELTKNIAEINAVCPLDIDEVTKWTSCLIQEPYFVYNYLLDEDVFEDTSAVLAYLNGSEIRQTFRDGLLESLNSDNTMELLNKAGLGIRFHYEHSLSGRSIDIDFSPEEVASM